MQSPAQCLVQNGSFLSVCSDALMQRLKITGVENGECLETEAQLYGNKGEMVSKLTFQ